MKSLALCLPLTLLLSSFAYGQQNPTTDLMPGLKKQCRTIQVMFDHHPTGLGANFQAARTLCINLEAKSGAARAQTAHDLYQLLARMNLPPATPADRFAALESAASGKEGRDRFYALANLAKVAFETGDVDKATAYAQELLQVAPQFPKDWNYGNAIYYGHFVLGRVALREGKTEEAASQLLDAGATPGSPQLNSFGPNLTLAKDLLAKHQTKPVLEYLAECKIFWKMDRGRLDQWTVAIRAGNTPKFGANLNY